MTFQDLYDGFLFDLDGVVYTGQGAIPGAAEAISALKEDGFGIGFVTNNASRSEAAVAAHLRELGVPADESSVFGSARTGVELLGESVERGAAVFVVGSEYLAGLVAEAGYEALSLEQMEAGARADAVIQGFDPGLGWRHLAAASYAIADGAAWVATNKDATIPRAEGIAPGNGSLVATVETATGRTPAVGGKPQAPIFERARRELGLERPLMCGDRLDTDIAGANAAGIDSALVLTGIDGRQAAERAEPDLRPTFVIDSLSALVSGEDPERLRLGGGEK